MAINKEHFGKTSEGIDVDIYTIKNSNNASVSILTYGGIIQKLCVPDRNNNIENVVLGYNTVSEYESLSPYFGCLTGRFAGRISNASFEIEGTEYKLAANDNSNCLHGGIKGLDKRVLKAQSEQDTVTLTYRSPHMEENFPGNVDIAVSYTFTDDNALTITYKATSDRDTYLTLTNHSYFNLSGDLSSKILDHELMLNCSSYIGIDSIAVPQKILSTLGTPFDFTTPKSVGKDINKDHEQLKNAGGYDHPFMIDEGKDVAATLYDEKSGRFLEVSTTEKFVVCYSGNYLTSEMYVYDQTPITKRSGICLETQYCPDHMHFNEVPTVTYGKDQDYFEKTTFKFSTK